MAFDTSEYLDANGQPTDKGLLALQRSIETQESQGNPNTKGASGETGLYQWMPGNYAAAAQSFGINPNDTSVQTQRKVAYLQMAQMKSQGQQPYQIASSWNSGSPDDWQNHSGVNAEGVSYDTPAYVQSVMSRYQQYLGGQGQSGTPQGQIPAADSTQAPPAAAAPAASITSPSSDPTGTTAPKGGGILNGAIGLAKGVVQSNVDDFKSLGNLLTGNIPKGQFWGTIGGSLNALSDVAILGGTVVGDVATEGANIAATPEEDAAAIAARNSAEKGAGAVAKKVAQSTVGRFAAGKGVGLAAQGVQAGVSSAANAKQAGASTGGAVASGVVSGGITMATFGVMNWLGPKASNSFLNLVSKLKFGTFVKDNLDRAVSYLQKAAGTTALGDVGTSIKNTVNAAAKKVVDTGAAALGGIAQGMKTPTASDVGALVERVSQNVSVKGNKAVEATFNSALKALGKFSLGKNDISAIESLIPQAPKAITDKEISAEAGRMAKAGETAGMEAGGILKQAESNLRSTATTQALSQDAETDLTQRSQALLGRIAGAGSATVKDVIDAINIKTPEAVEAALKSSWWEAIKKTVGSTPEGQSALQAFTDAMTARAKQNEASTFADTMRHAMAAGQFSWGRVVSSVLPMLKDEGSVTNLKTALGPDFGKFETMLTQKVFYDAAKAYQGVRSAAGTNITPKVASDAQKALASVIDKYATQFEKLPGLVDPEKVEFLTDIKNGIPTVESLAKNLGIDASKLGLATEGKAAQVGADTLKMVQNSPVGKVLAQESFTASDLPGALLKSSTEEVNALKGMLGEGSDEWATLGASVLGKVLNTVTGLFGTTDRNTIDKAFEKISTSVGGDPEKFESILGSSGKKLMSELANYANVLPGKGKVTKAASDALASIGFFAIHHVYISTVLASKAIKGFMSDDEIASLKAMTTMTKSDLKKEFAASVTQGGGIEGAVRGGAISLWNKFTQALGPLLKYEVGNKLMGQGAGSVVNDVTTPSETQ